MRISHCLPYPWCLRSRLDRLRPEIWRRLDAERHRDSVGGTPPPDGPSAQHGIDRVAFKAVA